MRAYAVRLVAVLALALLGVTGGAMPGAEATIAATGAARPPATATSLVGSTPFDLPGAGPWWSSPLGLVTIAVGGLLVLVVGGLGIALLTGLAVGGRRRRRAADRASAQPDSAGRPFK